ncbi:hypothetical protein EXIGLDRAFT_767709 [Exidia glandulosa HHB12029]|uniref:Uncharacterized protein n=1 Tax=Exidia glandulosa HHB12029 TaxID=1314781 RepID=A0A165IT78_EXIGL|nr:hypothetical protein EXIGLDRAFT_767709 [Exidia glandulosa HHB12029]
MASHVPAPVEPRDPQLGPDYPNVPREYAQTRNPLGGESGRWWDMQNRRNFGEPLHAEDEALSVWSPDVPHVPPQRALFHFSIACLCFVAYGVFVPFIQVESPAAPRSYPYDGLVTELGGLEENKARVETVDDEE